MRPNGNDQGFLASNFEFVDCNFIKEPRPNVAKGHERVFLRTLLRNFPTICNRQRIADSIAGFLVDRYVAFKRCTWRRPNKSLVIYPHPFPNFTRIDLGHGSGRAHSKRRHKAANVVLSFNQITFRTGLLLSLRIEKCYHVNDHKSPNRVGIAVFSSGQLSLKRRQQRLGGRTCTKF